MDQKKLIQKIISVLDLTSLNTSDSPQNIQSLCALAKGEIGPVAAVCVFPDFISTCLQALAQTNILVATVVNFPSGDASLSDTKAEITAALAAGVDEIDVVVPYKDFLKGNHKAVADYIKACKAQCHNKTLKVIIETGELNNTKTIYELSLLVLNAGADFIKTSTGKVPIGATLEAAGAMLEALKSHQQSSGKLKGLKLSGGIRSLSHVKSYLELCQQYFGNEFIQAKTFRIGASSLLTELQQRYAEHGPTS